MSKGFANLSKNRRKEISKQGGVKAQQKGTAHTYNKLEAKAAHAKSLAVRKRKCALNAAKILLEAGFTAEQLYQLELSYDALIYYGGGHRTQKRMLELARRVLKLKETDDESKTDDNLGTEGG